MQEICKEVSNVANKSSYEAFKALPSAQQRKLVGSTYVLGSTNTVVDLAQDLKKKLRTTVETKHIESFLTRLEGAWFDKAIQLLATTGFAAISLGELVSIIDDLRSQFLPGNLPADFDEALPEVMDIEGDSRIFVEQLRLIDAPNSVIELAIINYYRAYEQRSRWLRENLVKPGEIGKYLARLKDEWNHHRSLQEMNITSHDNINPVQLGRNIYSSCQNEGARPIRRDFDAKYVARGTYHTLADSQGIGWRADFKEQLCANNEGVA